MKSTKPTLTVQITSQHKNKKKEQVLIKNILVPIRITVDLILKIINVTNETHNSITTNEPMEVSFVNKLDVKINTHVHELSNDCSHEK